MAGSRVNDIERALAQISDIKAQLAASTRFRGYAPEVLVGVAILAAVVTAAQMMWPEQLSASGIHHVVIWGTFLVLSNLAIGAEAVSRSRWQHRGMAPEMLQSAMRIQLPFTAVGIIVAFGICRFAPETAWIVPGIWLLLIALVAFCSRAILPQTIVWAGVWYLLSGALAIVLAGQGRQFFPWMFGVPLFVGHMFIAWALKREGEETDVG